MNCYFIIAMRVGQRVQTAAAVQEALTRYGCFIKTRLGLHDIGEDYCANDGIVILQVCGQKADIEKMTAGLNEIEGVKAKLMDLDD